MPVVGTNSLFELKLFGDILGNATLNRFFYFLPQPPDTVEAVDVVFEFETKLAAIWEAAVSVDWDGTRVTCDEVTSIQNFFDSTTNIGPGTGVGVNMPPYVSASIRLFRTTKETRSGWKRIGGILEEQQQNGALEVASLAAFNTLADGFADTLPSVGGSITPAIVRVTLDPATGDPNPADEWVYNLVASAAANSNLSTQNTRKFGRGI